jgi:hypothetical protein
MGKLLVSAIYVVRFTVVDATTAKKKKLIRAGCAWPCDELVWIRNIESPGNQASRFWPANIQN